tara:strand:- start:23 stop:1000 length:978 start_codon:yes stop_codon:yes gene_type:complete
MSLNKYITRRPVEEMTINPNEWSADAYRGIGQAIGEAMLNSQNYIARNPSIRSTRYDDFNQNRFYGTPFDNTGIMANDLQADNLAPIYEDDLIDYNEHYNIDMPKKEEDEENPWYTGLMEYVRENLPNIVGRAALIKGGAGAGAMLGGIPGLLLGLFAGAKAPFRDTPSMQAWGQLNPTQRSYASNLYRPGGILQGYNPVSAYGSGPIGTLQKRRENILRTISKPGYRGTLNRPGGRLEQIEKAIANLGGGNQSPSGRATRTSVPSHIGPSGHDIHGGSSSVSTGNQGPAGGATTSSAGWADDGYWAKGGRVSYSKGGLASLWQR